LVASVGATVAVKVVVSPVVNAAVVELRVTDVTRTTGAVTVMFVLPDLPEPSWAVAVIVARPGPTAVTFPV